MHVTQEDFEQACANVIAVITEHRGAGEDGLGGSLRLLGLDPMSAMDVADELAADGLSFLAGLLVGVQLAQGAEVA